MKKTLMKKVLAILMIVAVTAASARTLYVEFERRIAEQDARRVQADEERRREVDQLTREAGRIRDEAARLKEAATLKEDARDQPKVDEQARERAKYDELLARARELGLKVAPGAAADQIESAIRREEFRRDIAESQRNLDPPGPNGMCPYCRFKMRIGDANCNYGCPNCGASVPASRLRAMLSGSRYR